MNNQHHFICANLYNINSVLSAHKDIPYQRNAIIVFSILSSSKIRFTGEAIHNFTVDFAFSINVKRRSIYIMKMDFQIYYITMYLVVTY